MMTVSKFFKDLKIHQCEMVKKSTLHSDEQIGGAGHHNGCHDDR